MSGIRNPYSIESERGIRQTSNFLIANDSGNMFYKPGQTPFGQHLQAPGQYPYMADKFPGVPFLNNTSLSGLY